MYKKFGSQAINFYDLLVGGTRKFEEEKKKKQENPKKIRHRKRKIFLELELGNVAEAKFGAIENTAQIRYCWAHLRLSDYIMLISNWVFKMKNNQVPRKTLARV